MRVILPLLMVAAIAALSNSRSGAQSRDAASLFGSRGRQNNPPTMFCAPGYTTMPTGATNTFTVNGSDDRTAASALTFTLVYSPTHGLLYTNGVNITPGAVVTGTGTTITYVSDTNAGTFAATWYCTDADGASTPWAFQVFDVTNAPPPSGCVGGNPALYIGWAETNYAITVGNTNTGVAMRFTVESNSCDSTCHIIGAGCGTNYTLCSFVPFNWNRIGSPSFELRGLIYSDAFGLPGTVLALSTNTVAASSINADWSHSARVSGFGLPVTNGVSYWFAVTNIMGDSANYLRWWVNTDGPCNYGMLAERVGGAWQAHAETRRPEFRIDN